MGRLEGLAPHTVRNCFARVLLDLQADSAGSSLFSRGCADIFTRHDFDRWGYRYIQVFEPNVLAEIIHLHALDAGRTESLQAVRTPQARRLKELVDGREALADAGLANTVGALISVSRFALARRLLADLDRRKLGARGRFEAAWLGFLISNRCDDGRGSQAAFDRMRAAAETGEIPAGRVLDLCTQGVVWRLKRQEISAETFRWCLETGARLSHRVEGSDRETAASWYRGLAMLPAARKDAGRTRAYMERARDLARAAIGRDRDGGLEALNQLKTYYESSIKEFLYVSPDRDRALEAARALVDLDPLWPLSLAEMGEVHARFEDHEDAARCFERAAALGPPYVGAHLLQAARLRARMGDRDAVLGHRDTLRRMAPDDTARRQIDQVCP